MYPELYSQDNNKGSPHTYVTIERVQGGREMFKFERTFLRSQ